jgi:hypothetical protein
LLRAPCDLRHIVRDAARAAQNEVVAITDGPPVPYVGDATLLTRAISYLLAHAQRVHLSEDANAIQLSIDLAAPWQQPAATDAWWQLCSMAVTAHNGRVRPTPAGLCVELTTRLPA